MREIKFRGWYGESLGMREPQFNGFINEIFAEQNGVYMQYTGIKDKNGVEIFEGDVVKADVGDGYLTNHKIIFELGRFTMEDLDSGSRCLWILTHKCEVIGNIYENPELLNQ